MATWIYENRRWRRIEDDEEIPPGAYVVSDTDNPPEDVEKALSMSVDEESIVERLSTYIEGSMRVLPTKMSYNPAEVVYVNGCGNQFSGKYYITSVEYTVDQGAIDIVLFLLRTNLEPVDDFAYRGRDFRQPTTRREAVL